MPENYVEPPKKFIQDIRIYRFSAIFFNITIFCLCLAALAALATIIIPLFMVLVILVAALFLILLFFLVIATFGLILLDPNNPIRQTTDFINNINTEKAMDIATKFMRAIPYLCIAGLVFAVLTIITAAVSKHQNKVVKIVLASIFAGIMIITLIIYFWLGGILWQN